MSETRTIQSEVLRAEIDADGAFIRSLAVIRDGELQQIFQPGKSLFVMGPYVGRVEGAAFPWRGENFELKHPEDPAYAMHGCFRNVKWEWIVGDDKCIVLTLHSMAIEERYPYPSLYEAEIRYSVEAATLTVHIEVKNTGADNLPFGTGPHMYALKQPEGTTDRPRLQHSAKRWFPTRDDAPLIQGTSEELPQDRRYEVLKPWKEEWDHCVTDWGSEARIVWPELMIIIKDLSQNSPYLQIWNIPERDVCAVEPQTMCPGKLGDTKDATTHGCRILPPGESFSATWSFEFVLSEKKQPREQV